MIETYEYPVSFWDSHFNSNTASYTVRTMTMKQLAERFAEPVITNETVEAYALWGRIEKNATHTKDRIKRTNPNFKNDPEYRKATELVQRNKSKRSQAKNQGCFFAGVYDPQKNRGNGAVLFRSMLAFDLDKNMDKSAFKKLIEYLDKADCDYLIHTTHSHTPDRGRFRIYVPLMNKINDQAVFEAVGQAFSDTYLPVEWLDDTTYQWARLMYMPSVPQGGQYLFKAETEKGPFDLKRLHLNRNEIKQRQQAIKNHDLLKGEAPANDPRENKVPIIRYFCRAFTISQAIEKFLSDVYEPTKDATRYSFIDGSGAAGFKIFAGDLYGYSHDESDPAGWSETDRSKHSVNAYDLVRVHMFHGDRHAMNNWAYSLPEIDEQIHREMQAEFEDLDLLDELDSVAPADYPEPDYPEPFDMEIELPQEPESTVSAKDPALEDKTEGVMNMHLLHSRNVDDRFADFEKEINTAFRPISTGFEALDELLAGGLYAGTYFIGAVSSLGKTTLALQIADNIASQGQDVMFFSLEMSATELMAKSISRVSAQMITHEREDFEKFGSYPLDGALQVHEILRGPQELADPERLDLFERAKQEYRNQTGQHLYIVKEQSPISIQTLKAYVTQHVNMTGNRPVVVLDYLQVLKPENEKQTEKQATDDNVLKLKALSVQHDIPILTISSFNRVSYYSPVSPESFKESGNIEYGADVLIGLQYQGMDYRKVIDTKGNEKWEDEKSRNMRVRESIEQIKKMGREGKAQPIQVKVMKNRRYLTGSIDLFLYPKYNMASAIDYEEFTDDPEDDDFDFDFSDYDESMIR